MPILPHYVVEFGATPTAFGLLMSSYAAMQFVAAPLWGRLSDRVGRRPALLITIAGGAASMLALSVAPSLTLVFGARILSGIFAGNIGLATAYITDVTDESNRAKGMGLIGVAFGVGFILGPALGGILARFGHRAPMYCGAALGAVNFVQAFFVLREPASHALARGKMALAAWWRAATLRNLISYNFILTLAITQLEATLVYFLADHFQFDEMHAGYVLAYTAFVMALVQGGLVRRIRAAQERSMFLGGMALLGASLAALPFAHALSALLVILSCASIGRGLAQPMLLSLVSKHARVEDRGAVMGATQSAASLARVFAPAFAGWLYVRHPNYPFMIAAFLVLCLTAVATTQLAQRSQSDVESA